MKWDGMKGALSPIGSRDKAARRSDRSTHSPRVTGPSARSAEHAGLTMRHKATQDLFAYWNEVRRGRLAPNRLEIVPQRIGDALLDAFILERVDAHTYRFRLAGARISARFGMDLRDTNFLDRWTDGDQSMLETYLAATTEHGRAALFTVEATCATEGRLFRSAPTRATFEILVLPLVHTGNSIDRLLGVLVPLDMDVDAALSRVTDARLIAAEGILPDLPVAADLQSPERQRPLYPHVRNARIVRQGRRQFRVYQGGLD